MEPLHIQITKTSDGRQDYVQITSADQLSINLVLIAEQITVKDHREPSKPKPKRKRESEIQA